MLAKLFGTSFAVEQGDHKKRTDSPMVWGLIPKSPNALPLPNGGSSSVSVQFALLVLAMFSHKSGVQNPLSEDSWTRNVNVFYYQKVFICTPRRVNQCF